MQQTHTILLSIYMINVVVWVAIPQSIMYLRTDPYGGASGGSGGL